MSRAKKVARERMALTGESYVTALMRVRECEVDMRDPLAASATIQQSPPRLGNLLLRPETTSRFRPPLP